MATLREIEWLRLLDTEKNEIALKHVRHWNAGSPAYRWVEHVTDRIVDGRAGTVNMIRMWTYVTVAMYNATIAAWDSKYFYNRQRPSQVDPTLSALLSNPRSPSYPSEYAATAGAASEILAYLYPDEAVALRRLAEEAGRSRLYARVEFPSDYEAGLALGRAVAAKVIDRARADGSDSTATLTVPTGPGFWLGTNPIGQTIPTWRAFLLSRNNEFPRRHRPRLTPKRN